MRILTGLVLALAAPLAAEPLQRVHIDAADATSAAATLESLGFDVLEGTAKAGSLEVVVTPEDLARLRAAGYRPTVLETGRPFREIQADSGEGPAGTVPSGYLTLDEIYARMSGVAAAYPSICRLVDLTQSLGAPPTFEGRHLYALKISDNVGQDEDEPGFLLVSAHHCREIVTPVIALEAIDRLTQGYGVDVRVTGFVDGSEIWVAPIWNPDGYERVFNADNLWRKNRRVFATGTGVDLNRNYPLGWSATCAGSTNPTSLTYKGPGPGSEAETATMMALALDRHFATVLDLHSSGREAIWGYNCLGHPWDAYLRGVATAVSTAAGYGGDQRRPSAEGESIEWLMAEIASRAVLVETATSFQPSYSSAQSEAAMVWPAIEWLLEAPIPLSGHVVDGCAGAPLVAAIRYPGTAFANGERNGSFLPFGRYHAFLPPGPHLVEFSSPGYETEAIDLTVPPVASAQTADVLLFPAGGCPGCSPAALTPRTRLRGVKDGRGGAWFTWEGEAAAPAYHLNSVADPTDLLGDGAKRAPVGRGAPQCVAVGPQCADPDAISSPPFLLFYQVFSTCGATGLEEGPG